MCASMHMCTHATFQNHVALIPEIEEGAVNQHPLQALFLLPLGAARSANGPGAILNLTRRYDRGLVAPMKIRPPVAHYRTPDQTRLVKLKTKNHLVRRRFLSPPGVHPCDIAGGRCHRIG